MLFRGFLRDVPTLRAFQLDVHRKRSDFYVGLLDGIAEIFVHIEFMSVAVVEEIAVGS